MQILTNKYFYTAYLNFCAISSFLNSKGFKIAGLKKLKDNNMFAVNKQKLNMPNFIFGHVPVLQKYIIKNYECGLVYFC